MSFDRLTPRVIAKYEITYDVSVYASYSQGFQAGAFQGFQLAAANALVPINETIVSSTEIGLRSQWFDNRLTVNLTAFDADYDDLPTTQFTSASGFLEARTFDTWIRGLEVNISARPTPALILSATFGLTDNFVPNNFPATIGPPLVPGRTRNELKCVSPFSGRFSAQYVFELPGDAGSITVNGNVTVQDEFYTSTVNNPFAYEDGYTLVGLQADYATADDRWAIGAVVKNLTDEVYELRSSADGGGSRTYGPPANWYLSLQYRF